MVRTRQFPDSDDEPEFGAEDVESVESTVGVIRKSDPAYNRKLVIAKEEFSQGCSLRLIRHPRLESPVLFRIGESSCDEVVIVDDDVRCLFVGDSVVSDGKIRLFSPFHPLFIALPYLIKKRANFEVLEEILQDEDAPDVKSLENCKQLKATLENVADVKNVLDEFVIRYNEDKAIAWLVAKYAVMKEALVQNVKLHDSISSNAEVLDRYAFSVFCDYLPTCLVASMRSHLGIVEAPKADILQRDHSISKRKADDVLDENTYSPADRSEPPPKKPPAKSTTQKRLEAASKGTKSLASFFANKKKE